MKVILFAVAMACLAFAQSGFDVTDMPTCLSNCMTPFPANHAGDTCTANWTISIESCINRFCSTSVTTEPTTDTRTTLFFSPKRLYSCQQSFVPGADQSSPSLQLQAGVCGVSPYPFQSFVMGWGQNGGQDNCTLEISAGTDCSGATVVINLEKGEMGGQCQFIGGQSVVLACSDGSDTSLSDNQAARNYLASFCNRSIQSSSGTPRTTSTTPSLSHANSTLTTTFIQSGPTSTTMWSNMTTTSLAAHPVMANVSFYSSSVVAPPVPVVPVSGPLPDSSESDTVVKRTGVAQWALVVVVFARSLMY